MKLAGIGLCLCGVTTPHACHLRFGKGWHETFDGVMAEAEDTVANH
jgi:hypothetical protein